MSKEKNNTASSSTRTPSSNRSSNPNQHHTRRKKNPNAQQQQQQQKQQSTSASLPPKNSKPNAGGMVGNGPTAVDRVLDSSKAANGQESSVPRTSMGEQYEKLCNHLYQKGFMTGYLSDVTLQAFDQQYHMHRIILAQSPYLERLMLEQDSQIIHLPLPLPSIGSLINASFNSNTNYNYMSLISAESLSICLAYIYASPVTFTHHLKQDNMYNCLACACLLELDELAEHCVRLICDSITVDNISQVVDYLTKCTPPSETSNNGIASLSAGGGKCMEKCLQVIKTACIEYLASDLPSKLQAFPSHTTSESDAAAILQLDNAQRMEAIMQLKQVYAKLPYNWLKCILEERLMGPTEFEKYQFAKQVIESRKIKGESVVIVFDRDMKGKMVLSNKKQ